MASNYILQYLEGTINLGISFSVCTCSEELQQLQFYNVDCEGNGVTTEKLFFLCEAMKHGCLGYTSKEKLM